MGITRVRARNFRALGDVDLKLNPFTVVIGPNGAGKSSLLEMIKLLGSLHQGEPAFTDAFTRYGGYRATVSYYASDAVMRLGITTERADQNGPEFEYDVEFSGEGNGYFVRWEKVLSETFGLERRDTLGEKKVVGRWISETITEKQSEPFRLDHGPELAVTEIPQAREELNNRFAFGKRMHLFQCYKFQPNEQLRAPQPLKVNDEIPKGDGINLLSSLYNMKTERPALYADLMDTLRTAIPQLGEIDYPLAGDMGYVNLRWKDKNLARPFTAFQVSDGILRLLWLATILHSAPDDGLLMFDEPEISLHPEWIMLLVAMLRNASARTNVLVATQSAELVRWLEPEELLIADMAEDGARFRWANEHPNLNEWLEDFTLAQLWTMGELGGRR